MTTVETDEILDAVRTVLGADGLTRAATGRLRHFAELGDTMEHSVLPEHETRVEIRSARVVRADETTATVDLDATTSATWKVDGRTRTSTSKAQGPVQLVREDGVWKVVDLVVDGLGLLARYFDRESRGSAGALHATVLGARVMPEWVLAYLEVDNGTGAPVRVRSVVVGQSRSLLPGSRWARGTLALEELPPGTTRLEATGALHNVRTTSALRFLLDTDAGLVDVRPASRRPARRRIPVKARFPWAWGSLVVAAVVAVLGVVFSWWLAGIALIQIAAVALFSFEGHLRRGMPRHTALLFGWTLAGLALGLVLFFGNGGIGRFRGGSEHDRVTDYVEGTLLLRDARVERAAKWTEDGCGYRVWDVRTPQRALWIVVTPTAQPDLELRFLPHSAYATVEDVRTWLARWRRGVAKVFAGRDVPIGVRC